MSLSSRNIAPLSLLGRAALVAVAVGWSTFAAAQSGDTSEFSPPGSLIDQICRGLPLPSIQSTDPKKCAATIYLGIQNNTTQPNMFGIGASFVPPYEYTFGNSYYIAGSLSRVLGEIGDLADVEIETGVGQRFGSLDQEEVWIALYGRWKYFPWNNYLLTTVAVSTGLSYASAVPEYEVMSSGINMGQRLLHFLSPEITFALPSHPDTEFVIRNFHRSGGGEIWGTDVPVYGSIFHGVAGGVQYLSAGLRQHF